MSKPLIAQFVGITDAPFTATLADTVNGQPTGIEEIARASNGSTYHATKAKDGHIVHITIVDIPGERRIELMATPLDHTYMLEDAGNGRTLTIEEYRASLQRRQDALRETRDGDDGKHRQQFALGTRQQDGMTLFGRRQEIDLPYGEKETLEIWQSDLGIEATTFEKTATRQITRVLTNLHRIEPDPKLFEIPPEYLPHPDPLVDGKKVFVDNQTGVPEVKDAAVAGFNAFAQSKHSWVVVDSMDEADLVAVFANVTRADDLDPPFEMKIHAPHSDQILFVSHLRHNPAAPLRTYPAPEKSLARACVGDLWNRVANIHVGQVYPVAQPAAKTAP